MINYDQNNYLTLGDLSKVEPEGGNNELILQ